MLQNLDIHARHTPINSPIEINIKPDVRKGCVASPHLFLLYTEITMLNIDDMEGFRVGCTVINNLRYADDTVIIEESEEQLQDLISVIAADSAEKGLMLNCAKPFTIVFSTSSTVPKCKTACSWNKYLGVNCTLDERCQKEIRRRIFITSQVNIENNFIKSKIKSTQMLCLDVWI